EAWIPGKIRTKKEKTDRKTIMRKIKELETDMKQAAREWDFEYAAILRDKIFEYKGIINSKKN
ncbi:MAG: UvrB/UvrC motif-containing protein, partial [bacterium]